MVNNGNSQSTLLCSQVFGSDASLLLGCFLNVVHMVMNVVCMVIKNIDIALCCSNILHSYVGLSSKSKFTCYWVAFIEHFPFKHSSKHFTLHVLNHFFFEFPVREAC